MIEAAIEGTNAVPSMVSFWPHPREVLFGEARLHLDLPNEKLSLLEPLGIEQLVLVPFTSALARLSAKAFVKTILLDTLKAQRIAVGTNFRFGYRRSGDAALLRSLASNQGVDVKIVDSVGDAEGRMSSSRIRTALEQGALDEAGTLLGRPYRFQGKVVSGRGLGRRLGWPTANLQVDGRKFLPKLGVYAAWASLDGIEECLPAVMNLGPQPTVDPDSPSAVEVNLLDRDLKLKQRKLLIEPVQWLRGQLRFNNLQALSEQIGQDAEQARRLLQRKDQDRFG
ncbi:bifunctional riboflavin kinase/FAD synthetase [Synechococcus sp. M16CYN]